MTDVEQKVVADAAVVETKTVAEWDAIKAKADAIKAWAHVHGIILGTLGGVIVGWVLRGHI